jgi:hypothetical protein
MGVHRSSASLRPTMIASGPTCWPSKIAGPDSASGIESP